MTWRAKQWIRHGITSAHNRAQQPSIIGTMKSRQAMPASLPPHCSVKPASSLYSLLASNLSRLQTSSAVSSGLNHQKTSLNQPLVSSQSTPRRPHDKSVTTCITEYCVVTRPAWGKLNLLHHCTTSGEWKSRGKESKHHQRIKCFGSLCTSLKYQITQRSSWATDWSPTWSSTCRERKNKDLVCINHFTQINSNHVTWQ